MKTFKRHRDYWFFDQDIRWSKLSQLGDPLEKLNNGVNFEMFRATLEDGLSKEPKGPGGRPPYDYVMMFKIAIFQRYFNLSDEQAEYQINERMNFIRLSSITSLTPAYTIRRLLMSCWTKRTREKIFMLIRHIAVNRRKKLLPPKG